MLAAQQGRPVSLPPLALLVASGSGVDELIAKLNRLQDQPAEGADLLPDPDSADISWIELVAHRPKVEQRGAPRSLLSWWASGREEDFLAVWPPRTKTDLSIRRSRAKDLWLHLKNPRLIWVRSYVDALAGAFDYVSVLILGWAFALYGPVWAARMTACGAFDDGIEHYVAVCKYLSDRIKTRNYRHPDRFLYVEQATSVGYRNPPYPGFDLMDEAAKLADGGLPHPLPQGWSFAQVAREALRMDVPHVDWISFDDYVLGCSWLTTGASSVGHLEFTTPDGEHHRVKARKNFVPDVIPLPELIMRARDSTRQVNTTLIKSELGKIRLAVASDLETYLKMTWMLHLLGGAYKQWPGSTIEETTDETDVRLRTMLNEAAEAYGLPFDYKAFDHQPSLDELVELTRILVSHARRNVPVDALPDYDLLMRTVLDGFRSAVLVARDGASVRTFPVLGGLMSGLRLTTVLGNAWNTVMTEIVRRLLSTCVPDLMSLRYIRGDDSAIFSPSGDYLRLMAQGYKAVGVEGGDGKFSVRRHEMEFLRVWFSDRCHGYAARALPGLVQRKPWSSAPWEEENVLRAIRETCDTLARRGVDAEAAWRTISSHWCSLHRLPRAVLQVPRHLGGFGLEPWDGMTRLSSPVPRVERPALQFEGVTNWRRDAWVARAAEYGEVLSTEAAQSVAAAELRQVVASDDVPAASRAARAQWKVALRNTRVRAVRSAARSLPLRPVTDMRRVVDVPSLRRAVSDRVGNYGSMRSAVNRALEAKPMLRPLGLTLRQWIRKHEPALDVALRQLGGHLAEALDWLGGTVAPVCGRLHPALRSFVGQRAASLLGPPSVRHRFFLMGVSVLGHALATEIASLPFVTQRWSW